MKNLKRKETPEEVYRRMREQEFNIDEWLENERDWWYIIQKVTGERVTDDSFAMRIEALKEAMVKDPEFKRKDGSN